MADATASTLAAARDAIRRLDRAPEPHVLAPLLSDAVLDPESRSRVEQRTLVMLEALRYQSQPQPHRAR